MLVWLFWLLCGAVIGAGLLVIFQAIRSAETQRRDPALMNMLLGDTAKYDRLVSYHGSPEKARQAWINDNR